MVFKYTQDRKSDVVLRSLMGRTKNRGKLRETAFRLMYASSA